MKQNCFKAIILFVGLLFCFGLQNSCQKQKQSKTNSNFKKSQTNDLWLNRKTVLPDSLISLVGDQKMRNDNLKLNGTRLIIYFDANCSMCFLQVIRWKEFMATQNFPNDKLTMLYVFKAPNSTLLELNLNQIDFPLNLAFWDINTKMTKDFPFLSDDNYENCSFLLNENNYISFIGNPVNNLEDFNKLSVILKGN